MAPSSNWLTLKKNLTNGSSRPSKRRKVDALPESTSVASSVVADSDLETESGTRHMKGRGDSLSYLQQMVCGQKSYPAAHQLLGKYVAIDCEMVGIAGDSSKNNVPTRDKGDESSLARVSVVNYHGAVQLDVFVRQRERVTDWRTAVSGVRETNMVHAKSFSEAQKLVADLLQDKILVGHAVHNDLKALLLSHPHKLTRDTQVLAGRHGTISTTKSVAPGTDFANLKVSINRKPALRKLVIQELGIDIQAGEHSSVTDARAAMAIYRLHRKTWDKGFLGLAQRIDRKSSNVQPNRVQTEEPLQSTSQHNSRGSKRNRIDHSAISDEDAADSTLNELAGTHGKRQSISVKQKGISSGLSVVVKTRKSGTEVKQTVSHVRGRRKSVEHTEKWWGTLGN